jgi:hypothetical protein
VGSRNGQALPAGLAEDDTGPARQSNAPNRLKQYRLADRH